MPNLPLKVESGLVTAKLPVPVIRLIPVAPVVLPILIDLAFALVPILILPVVPLSKVTALVVVDCKLKVVPPVMLNAAVLVSEGVVTLVVKVGLWVVATVIEPLPLVMLMLLPCDNVPRV